MDVREKLVEILTNAGMGKYETQFIADILIANGVTVQRWIPVTERLPDKLGFYLVASKYGTVGTELFHRIGDDNAPYFGGKWVQKGHYTHWMPLPEPPKGES